MPTHREVGFSCKMSLLYGRGWWHIPGPGSPLFPLLSWVHFLKHWPPGRHINCISICERSWLNINLFTGNSPVKSGQIHLERYPSLTSVSIKQWPFFFLAVGRTLSLNGWDPQAKVQLRYLSRATWPPCGKLINSKWKIISWEKDGWDSVFLLFLWIRGTGVLAERWLGKRVWLCKGNPCQEQKGDDRPESERGGGHIVSHFGSWQGSQLRPPWEGFCQAHLFQQAFSVTTTGHTWLEARPLLSLLPLFLCEHCGRVRRGWEGSKRKLQGFLAF